MPSSKAILAKRIKSAKFPEPYKINEKLEELGYSVCQNTIGWRLYFRGQEFFAIHSSSYDALLVKGGAVSLESIEKDLKGIEAIANSNWINLIIKYYYLDSIVSENARNYLFGEAAASEVIKEYALLSKQKPF